MQSLRLKRQISLTKLQPITSFTNTTIYNSGILLNILGLLFSRAQIKNYITNFTTFRKSKDNQDQLFLEKIPTPSLPTYFILPSLVRCQASTNSPITSRLYKPHSRNKSYLVLNKLISLYYSFIARVALRIAGLLILLKTSFTIIIILL